jgi:hypothetical protein
MGLRLFSVFCSEAVPLGKVISAAARCLPARQAGDPRGDNLSAVLLGGKRHGT